jgi:hypothetical protein
VLFFNYLDATRLFALGLISGLHAFHRSANIVGRDVRVATGRRQILVAESLLQRQQITPRTAEAAGKGMPQIVEPEILDPGLRPARRPMPSAIRPV